MNTGVAIEQAQRITGANMKRLREDRGMTQEQVAALADMAPSHLRQIESGQGNPTLATLVKVALAMRAEMTDLFVNLPARPRSRPGRPKRRW